jgi:hypothetical protein
MATVHRRLPGTCAALTVSPIGSSSASNPHASTVWIDDGLIGAQSGVGAAAQTAPILLYAKNEQ